MALWKAESGGHTIGLISMRVNSNARGLPQWLLGARSFSRSRPRPEKNRAIQNSLMRTLSQGGGFLPKESRDRERLEARSVNLVHPLDSNSTVHPVRYVNAEEGASLTNG